MLCCTTIVRMPDTRLVSGGGDIKLTKDGSVLINEMVRHGMF